MMCNPMDQGLVAAQPAEAWPDRHLCVHSMPKRSFDVFTSVGCSSSSIPLGWHRCNGLRGKGVRFVCDLFVFLHGGNGRVLCSCLARMCVDFNKIGTNASRTCFKFHVGAALGI